jgi:hypothetical protein
MLEFECPHCGARSPYVAALAGREIFCLGCGVHILVPNLGPTDPFESGTESSEPIAIKFPPPRDPRKDANSGDSPASRE